MDTIVLHLAIVVHPDTKFWNITRNILSVLPFFDVFFSSVKFLRYHFLIRNDISKNIFINNTPYTRAEHQVLADMGQSIWRCGTADIFRFRLSTGPIPLFSRGWSDYLSVCKNIRLKEQPAARTAWISLLPVIPILQL